MAARANLGTLTAAIEANTRGYEMAMVKIEALTKAVTTNISRHTDPAAKSVDRLDKHFRQAAVGALALKAASALIIPTGLMSVLPAAGAGLAALGGGAVIATQAIVPLTGALAALPTLLGAAIGGVATLKLGTGDLMKVMAQSGNITKFNKELAKVDPATAAAAKQLYKMRDIFAQMKESAVSGFLPGLVGGLKSASANAGLLNSILHTTGQVFGGLAQSAGKYLGSKEFGDLFKQMQGTGLGAVKAMGEAFGNVFSSVMKLGVAAKPLIDLFIQGVSVFGNWVKKTTDAGIASGKFQAFIANAVETIKAWAHILGNIGSLIGSVFKAAAPEAQIFLGFLQGGTDKLKEWGKSTDGMKKMSDFFTNIAKPLTALGDGLGKIALSLGGLFSGPSMDALTSFISALGDGLSKVLSSGLESTIVSLGAALTPLIPVLADILVVISNVSSALLSALAPAFELLAPILDNWIKTAGPEMVNVVNQSAPAIYALADAVGQTLVAFTPLIPVVGQIMSLLVPDVIYTFANALVLTDMAILGLTQAIIAMARVFVVSFVGPIMSGIATIMSGLSGMARAVGQGELADSIDLAQSNIDNFTTSSGIGFDIASSKIADMQSGLHMLGYGVTVPINIVTHYSTTGMGGDYTTAAQYANHYGTKPGTGSAPIAGSAQDPASAAYQAAQAAKKYKTSIGNYTSNYHPTGGGGGGGGGQSAAASSKASAISSWASGVSGYPSSLTGIQSNVNPVVTAFNSMTSSVWKYLSGSLHHRLKTQEAAMVKLYNADTKAIAAVEKQQAVVDSLKQQRTSAAGQIQGNYLSYTGITNARQDIMNAQSGGSVWDAKPGLTGGSLLGAMKTRAAKAIAFYGTLIPKLGKAGLNKSAIAEIVGMGVDDGSQVAQAILASPDQITGFNDIAAQSEKYAKQYGTTIAGQLYDAGIAAAQGLLDGLKKNQKAIENQMKILADAMINEIKHALGIKSPSVEMMKIGQHSVNGLVKGIMGGQSAVTTTMRGTANAMLYGASTTAGGAGMAGAGGASTTVPDVHIHWHVAGQPDQGTIDAAEVSAARLLKKVLTEAGR